MTTPEDDNGLSPQSGGRHKPLTGLPPEWGSIIIPDDAAELDREATKIRKELKHALSGYPPGRRTPLLAPLLIVVLALLLGLSSLFSFMGPLSRPAEVTPSTASPDAPLRDISLDDGNGQNIKIGDYVPAVILLLDGCACVKLGHAVAAATPAGVTVILIGKEPPFASGPGIHLADPSGKVRAASGVGLPVATEAAVLLLDKDGQLTRILPGTNSVEDFRTELIALQG